MTKPMVTATTIADIQKRIKDGDSARQIVEEALAKAEAAKQYNAIISVTRERALRRADEIDSKLKAGEHVGRLAGVPFLAKDIYLTYGSATTAASNILTPFKAPYQSTVIEKLEAEGAIVIGKTNLDAFAHGGSTENSDFGPTLNPYDKTRVAGGSSGGSAAAVALDIVPFALGTDTGGSTRQPASFCGVVGVKPTYGTMSRYGIVAMASSTDTVGTFAHTVDDAALVFDIMAGQDPRDATTLPARQQSYLPADNPIRSRLKVGIIKEYMSDSVQPEVREAVQKQAKLLRDLDYEVQEVSLPTLDVSLAVYYIVVPAEISSNLSRYDGIKFGASAKSANDLQELYGQTRELFNAENKRRILIGTYVLSSGYIDAYYRKAQTVRTKLINEFAEAFKEYDVLIGPVAPTTAFKVGENTDDPLQMYLADVMTVAASLAGVPGLSVPAGQDNNGLPIGVQLIGAQRSDALLFSIAKDLEEANRG
jgi:aspartyl-tRNA(Asn)/glutamyl-tRNA(Gln) amidotransferase subunit A